MRIQTPELLEHMKSRPPRPSITGCSKEEWAQYDKEFRAWSNKKDLLEVDAIKDTLDLSSQSPRYGDLFVV